MTKVPKMLKRICELLKFLKVLEFGEISIYFKEDQSSQNRIRNFGTFPNYQDFEKFLLILQIPKARWINLVFVAEFP